MIRDPLPKAILSEGTGMRWAKKVVVMPAAMVFIGGAVHAQKLKGE